MTLKNQNPCISALLLINYATGAMNNETSRRIGRHLTVCDLCLLKLHEFNTIEYRLANTADTPVPQALIRRVNALRPDAPDFQLVVKLVKNGLEILKRSVWPDNPYIRSLAMDGPAAVFRDRNGPTPTVPLRLEKVFEDKEIRIDMVNNHNVVDLLIKLTASQNALPNTRISLEQGTTLVASMKTDQRGELLIDGILPGAYQLVIASYGIEWSIEIVD